MELHFASLESIIHAHTLAIIKIPASTKNNNKGLNKAARSRHSLEWLALEICSYDLHFPHALPFWLHHQIYQKALLSLLINIKKSTPKQFPLLKQKSEVKQFNWAYFLFCLFVKSLWSKLNEISFYRWTLEYPGDQQSGKVTKGHYQDCGIGSILRWITSEPNNSHPVTWARLCQSRNSFILLSVQEEPIAP